MCRPLLPTLAANAAAHTFKVALMVFNCVRAQGPGYFDDVLLPVYTVGARARL